MNRVYTVATCAMMIIGYIVMKEFAQPWVGFLVMLLASFTAIPATHHYTRAQLLRLLTIVAVGSVTLLVLTKFGLVLLAVSLLCIGVIPWVYHTVNPKQEESTRG